MKSLKKILEITCAVGLSLILLSGCKNNKTPEIKYRYFYLTDFNNDDSLDFIEDDFKGNYRYFLNMGKGKFKEVKLELFDGIPFFRADSGYYSPWGEYLGDDGSYVNLKNKNSRKKIKI